MGLCGARVVMATLDNGDKVVGFCTARAWHDGDHSPEESLTVVQKVYVQDLVDIFAVDYFKLIGPAA